MIIRSCVITGGPQFEPGLVHFLLLDVSNIFFRPPQHFFLNSLSCYIHFK
jgi:hypothetical protein